MALTTRVSDVLGRGDLPAVVDPAAPRERALTEAAELRASTDPMEGPGETRRRW
jgi:hypothetical protein